jgi:hypothetical protein
MELSVVDPDEKVLNDRVDKMIGADTNMATIVKMALKPDCVDDETKNKLLYSIRLANEKEAKNYEEQFKFTMDCAGNIIDVNSIDERICRITELETDTRGELFESKGGSE